MLDIKSFFWHEFPARFLLKSRFLLKAGHESSRILQSVIFGVVMLYMCYRCACRMAFRPLFGAVQGRCAALHRPEQPVYGVAALAWECAAAHSHASAATMLNSG